MTTVDKPEVRSSDERARLSREAITEAARELIDEQGLNRLTMRALGDKLGVQAMSLYHYFDNKQELIEAISVRAASATAQFGARRCTRLRPDPAARTSITRKCSAFCYCAVSNRAKSN